MRPLQAKIIADLHVQPTIDPALEVRRSVDFLKNCIRITFFMLTWNITSL